ncbi:hypothetical protein DF034_04260 [Burkholderia anthina]|nr:hypothetical protein DF034_04260 [Burkholderia anthina]
MEVLFTPTAKRNASSSTQAKTGSECTEQNGSGALVPSLQIFVRTCCVQRGAASTVFGMRRRLLRAPTTTANAMLAGILHDRWAVSSVSDSVYQRSGARGMASIQYGPSDPFSSRHGM